MRRLLPAPLSASGEEMRAFPIYCQRFFLEEPDQVTAAELHLPLNWLTNTGSCLVVVFCRNRRVNLAMLVLLLIYYCVVAFPLWLWD